MKARSLLAGLSAGVLITSLAACGNDSSETDTDAKADGTSGVKSVDTTDHCAAYTANGDGFPATVEHALGETTIEAEPKRVVSIGWGNQDVALALGVAPVGSDDQTWSMDMSDGLGLYDWTTEAYSKLDADEPAIFDTTDGTDFAAIADTKPDLIIAGYSGLTEEDYATLTKIAPTVAYPVGVQPWTSPWRDVICIDSAALGKPTEGQALVDSIEDQIADAIDGASYAGKKAAFFYMDAADLSKVSVYGSGDGRTALLADLGFELPEAANTGEEFYADITSENADKLADVDVIVSYGEGDALLKALQADPLWSTIPAVANGAVVSVGAGDAYSGAVTPTALSIPWVIEQYVADLDAAAAQAK